jgi:hypothetical protein
MPLDHDHGFLGKPDSASAPVEALGNQAVRQAIRQVHTGRTTRRKSVVIAISRKRSPRFASTVTTNETTPP